MTRKQRRGTLLAVAVVGLSAAIILVMLALREGVDYFYTPTRVIAKEVSPGVSFRLGGLVAAGSVKRGEGTKVAFDVTDVTATVPVVFEGVLPDLFREGQGIIAIGKLEPSGRFVASSVLAKHDENYMPPEVAKSLKEQGVWQQMGKPEAAKSAPKQ